MSFGRPDRARVIAITSGKGGVGKTSVSVNLSVALARAGRRVMLLDGDLGLANANILMGINAVSCLEDVLDGLQSLDEIIHRGPAGVAVVPGGNGTGAVAGLGPERRRALAEAFRPHARDYDYVVIDTATGITPLTTDFVAATDMVTLVLTPEPTAFMDGYATVKELCLGHGCRRIAVIANLVEDEIAGQALFRRFVDVARRFLPAELGYLGSIPRDDRLREAVLRKRCVAESHPDARAATAFARLARAVDEQAVEMTPRGDRFFGLEPSYGIA